MREDDEADNEGHGQCRDGYRRPDQCFQSLPALFRRLCPWLLRFIRILLLDRHVRFVVRFRFLLRLILLFAFRLRLRFVFGLRFVLRLVV